MRQIGIPAAPSRRDRLGGLVEDTDMNKAIFALASLMLALAGAATAQTTTTYQAPTGSVSSTMIIGMNLTPSGSATLEPSLPSCYLGSTCTFSGSLLSYSLPDGSTATMGNFSGTFAPLPGVLNGYVVKGHASGVDSLGRPVKVKRAVATMTIVGHSGRGGGETKTYTGGLLAVAN
jgi:hypothetical protein